MTDALPGTAANVPLTTVLLANDHVLVRYGLKVLVSSILGEVRFVEAADGDAFLDAMRANPGARLAVVDPKIPAMRGGHRLLELSLRHPRIPLVVVSAPTPVHFARWLMKIHSVFAFVPKSATTDEVRAAITSAIAGMKVPLPPPEHSSLTLRAMTLTPRQQQICGLLRQGMSNKRIAAALGIGEGTVKNHITDIFRVLNATDRMQAAQLWAADQGSRAATA
jgi:DNA-binding NarL/FixJ family response regulator